MDGDDDDALTPRKALWRSASWSVRSSPTSAPPRVRPPRSGRPLLPPLQPLAVSRRHTPNEWPRPGSDDCHRHNPPLTPSGAAASNRECSLVADHVYLGSDAVARDRELLRRHGITHVLNCVGAASPDYFRGELAYRTLWLRDSPAEDITSVLYDSFDYLEEARAGGGRVLVHCLRGASRSAAIVVAYLMWRHAIPFDDALRRVRAVRAAADPNLGFAAQLLRCQRRILHTVPSSPGSPAAALPRAYRMAPHSPYDPLHLVPKAVDAARPALDSRGAFLVHAVSSTVFVWIGRSCEPAMADRAAAAARQVVRYEAARGPIRTVREGAETGEFWDALIDTAAAVEDPEVGKRRVELYNLDFEIFRRALRGLPVPGNTSETHLPARDCGWSRVREKFSAGRVRDHVMAEAGGTVASNEEVPFWSPGSFSCESSTMPSSSTTESASTLSTFSPASNSSLNWNKYSPPSFNLHSVSPPPHLLSTSPPLNSVEGNEKDTLHSAIAMGSLAERRGGVAPLVSLPPADDEKCRHSPRDVVRDWCLSPTFIPEVEEYQVVMDTE